YQRSVFRSCCSSTCATATSILRSVQGLLDLSLGRPGERTTHPLEFQELQGNCRLGDSSTPDYSTPCGVRWLSVREPLITISCDCGQSVQLGYGERWKCPSCGKTWDTSQIPRQEYDALLRLVRRYRLMVIVPPIVLAVILIPLGVLVDIRFAFLLFFLEIGF